VIGTGSFGLVIPLSLSLVAVFTQHCHKSPLGNSIIRKVTRRVDGRVSHNILARSVLIACAMRCDSRRVGNYSRENSFHHHLYKIAYIQAKKS